MPILLHYLNRFCNCPIDWRVSKVVISLGRILGRTTTILKGVIAHIATPSTFKLFQELLLIPHPE